MNKLKKIVILSLIVSLPINVLGFMWFHKTHHVYEQLDKFEMTFTKKGRFDMVAKNVFTEMSNQILYLFGISKKADVQLMLKKSGINQLFSNLPASGGDYQNNALLMIDNRVLQGKTKLRGDHMYHWALPSKSWRFKTSKKNIHNGINKYNFIVPKSADMLSNHMSYVLAQSLGLLAPDSRLVELSVNGIYYGARMMVEQIDESFLRKNRRMPNDIYKGDNIGQKKFMSVNVDLFNNASIWEKASINNHYDESNHVPLENLLRNLSLKDHEMINLESFAAMSALLDITSSYHHDRTHNWMLSYDHYYEKMFPVIWDTTGWNKRTVNQQHVNIATSELLQKLFNNYQFIREKYRIINEFYQFNENDFKQKLATEIKQAKEIISKNEKRTLLSGVEITQEASYLAIDEFNNNVIKKLGDIKRYFIGDVNTQDYQYALLKSLDKIRLSISGSKLVNGFSIHLNSEYKVKTAYLSYFHRDKEMIVDISSTMSFDDSVISFDIDLLASAGVDGSFSGTKTTFSEGTYDITLVGLNNNTVESVVLSFANNNQQKIAINKAEALETVAFKPQYHGIVNMNKSQQLQKWQGERYFSGFTEITDDITIEPGTKLVFDQGASLRVLGKVTAIGTSEEPIVFEAKDSTKPWGAFALKDRAADGSVFKHVIFKGGSGDKGDLHEYTAMFSIHNVHNLLVEDSQFYDSKLTDDMLHVIYSDVVFKNSRFVRSLSDALDIDISTAVIENCVFVNSGNDAIDLMTSDAVVINTTFKDSQDKGISIGEGSRLLAINNVIENNEIGMQSKDTSRAYIYNTSFIGNNTAIDAYHKNWRYSEGGSIFVDKCLMKDNKANATVGKKSQVVINNCEIDSIDNFDEKDVRKSKITISSDERLDADFELPFFDGYYDKIDLRTQGSYGTK